MTFWVLMIALLTVASLLWAARRLRRIAWRVRPSAACPPQIVIVGGGYVGLYTALRLQRSLRRREATVTVIDPRPTMTYQPFLAETAAGSIEPRHVVVSLRRVLRRCRVVTAAVSAIDTERRCVTAEPAEGPPIMIPYDHLVIGLGSVARTLPVPGLVDHAFGFKQIEEAVALRNHVLERLDIASASTDEQLRRRELTFVVVGGGYAGVEALAELEDMARHASRYHPTIAATDQRWHLVEASDRILPEVSPSLGRYTMAQLRRRQITVHLGTQLLSCTNGRVVLSNGHAFDAGTIVWTAGVRPHPLLGTTGLPLDSSGRILAEPTLAVMGTGHIWAAGDNAAVPDLTHPGAQCSPSAQHALRQARTLADNLVRTLRGRDLRPYRHRHAGSVASLGLHRGVAEIYGIRLRGLAAWLLHRTYHLAMMPTWNRRARIALDWTLALCLRRDAVSLGRLQRPPHDAAGAARFEPDRVVEAPERAALTGARLEDVS